MLVVKKLLYRILQWMAQKDSNPFVVVTAQPANSNVMTDVGSAIWCYHLFNDYYLVSGAVMFKTSEARSNLAAFRLRMGDKYCVQMIPWYQLCRINEATMTYSFNNNSDTWFNAPGTWNANAVSRWSIVGIGRFA